VRTVVYAVVAAVVVAAGVVTSFQRAHVTLDIRNKATLIAPAAPGGGWDTFMRESQHALRESGIATNIQVQNVPGAAGLIGLQRLLQVDGDPGTVMVGGIGQIAGAEQLDSPLALSRATPIARVIEEYNVVIVPADSPYRTLDDLIEAWRDDPATVPFTGGGSFDQLVMAQLAIAAGLEPTDVTYIPKSGGGEVVQALVTDTAAAAASGLPDVIDQIEGGRVRALAIAAREPVDGVDLPTLRELGYDVTLTNWRAVFAPPGLAPEQVDEIRDVYAEVVETPEWQAAVGRFRWTEVWMAGEELDRFVADEEQLIADLFKELGQ
jgi:putative tricarboxylic transport membrane protein